VIDETQVERRAQLIAAIAGLLVLATIAALVASSEGLGIGLAVFALGLTFVALFVLLVRFLVRRALASRPKPPPPNRTARRSQQSSARRRKRR
jgi:membrane protein implicated in regulation of membrane protease activity